jgi:hypothetical protein
MTLGSSRDRVGGFSGVAQDVAVLGNSGQIVIERG